jgi:two-component system, chemotaxis family, response regulator WspF
MIVAIVSASPAAAEVLQGIMLRDCGCDVAWIANEHTAIASCGSRRPDLLILDARWQAIDAVEITRGIMSQAPCPILLITDSLSANTACVFDAVGVGALDAVELPETGDRTTYGAPLVAKMQVLGRLIGLTDRQRRRQEMRAPDPSSWGTLVAIGASAGGPAAVLTLLAALPADLPAAVVIVQHVSEQFMAGMQRWLAEQSQRHIMLAAPGLRPAPGEVWMAGASTHLSIDAEGRFVCSVEPRHSVYRPSIDVFFESVSRFWGGHAIGILLTGMGRDGAAGLKGLRERGHHTIAQDEASCAVYGMPKAAASLDAAVEIAPLATIAHRLIAKVSELAGQAVPR